MRYFGAVCSLSPSSKILLCLPCESQLHVNHKAQLLTSMTLTALLGGLLEYVRSITQHSPVSSMPTSLVLARGPDCYGLWASIADAEYNETASGFQFPSHGSQNKTILTSVTSGWCLCRRLEDRCRSHRAYQASHPEPGTLFFFSTLTSYPSPSNSLGFPGIHRLDTPPAYTTTQNSPEYPLGHVHRRICLVLEEDDYAYQYTQYGCSLIANNSIW